MYQVFYEDVAEYDRVVLISDTMKVTNLQANVRVSLGWQVRRYSYNGKHGL